MNNDVNFFMISLQAQDGVHEYYQRTNCSSCTAFFYNSKYEIGLEYALVHFKNTVYVERDLKDCI